MVTPNPKFKEKIKHGFSNQRHEGAREKYHFVEGTDFFSPFFNPKILLPRRSDW